ncbi:hypothetical protein [Natranaeroarchaeum sulfidigenes]|uniref:CopG family transcriptional regulator n=1 Tax=Natranaeroarchaeum sulfidigenes TaxID=2784880 RepID=A0A897MTG4_9EURY|nr:hypothetical protein [Natranaeroarchaeum sulfidigenes]QSG01515.1 Uncharacterized protein AArcS_0280 [Natranaeroarchaeum sulfidigenes]
MASDDSRGGKTMIELPSDVYDWLDEAHHGDVDAVARRLLDAHRQLAAGGEPIAPSGDSDDSRPVTEAELDERLADLDATIDELIEDVRKRVIQLKRETDAKAPRDHDHEELRERLDGVEGRVADAEGQAESAAKRAADAESSLAAGFENYEEILTYLTEETDLLADRVDLLARAVIDLRSEVETVAAERARREAVDELKRAANQQGVRTAECDACSASVDIALLAKPRCPQCTERFVDVSAGGRFFRPNVLETGDPPALTSTDEPDDLGAELDAAFEEETDDAPDWEPPGEPNG